MENLGFIHENENTGDDVDDAYSEEDSYDKYGYTEDDETVVESVSSTVNSNDDKQPPKTEEWDLLKTYPEKRNQEAINELWKKINVGFKIFLCIMFFILVLSASIVTKITFLIIVYNVNITSHGFTLQLSPNTNYTMKAANTVTEVQWIWALFLIICAPYVFTTLRCLHDMCFKKVEKLKWRYFFVAMAIETIHSVGLGIFVYIAAPFGDSIFTLYLFQGVSLVPAVLKCLPSYAIGKVTSGTQILLSITSALVHLGFLVIVGLKSYSLTPDIPWLFPLATACVSIYWWENFVPRAKQVKGAKQDKGFFEKISVNVRHTKIDLGVTLWKICLNIAILLVIFAPLGCANTLFGVNSVSSNCTLVGNITILNEPKKFTTSYLPFILAGINVASSVIAFKLAKTACVIRCQIACFTLPLTLVTPVSFIIILLSYKYHFIHDILGYQAAWPKLDFNASWMDFLDTYTIMFWLPMLFVEFVNILITVHYIWRPGSSRVASTDTLFVKPLYCGVFFDQSLLLNRCSDDDIGKRRLEHKSNSGKLSQLTQTGGYDDGSQKQYDSTPMIYACATMWHETEREMTQLMKSIFRMDLDQFEKSFQKYYDQPSQDFYRFEAHIFFDDAFHKYKHTVNEYVSTFLRVLPIATRAVYVSAVELRPPIKYITPYGGRLEWVMPGNNKLIVHLKDKKKIRDKKRWSQVMYMYYLLSYLIIANKNVGKKDSVARNTFILALDGDVDFYPDAVQLLLDRMLKNKKLGAASGRIHPKGSGPMVWYQKFEYSVGHWLQKVTEHKLGCVLCSPGCFSLFRGSALLQHNVINKYATVSTEARHRVQYDLGEDRWLCTLLLKAGRRIEYCAAADASTYCPEGFVEFYKQRRRWTPSTMANIIDVLGSWNTIRKNNSDISILFIVYQVFLFVSSILTPGTIFLLILGAFNTAYPTVPLYAAFVLNLLPVVVFIIMCYTATNAVQHGYAAIMSTLYSLVMMIVIVGILKQIVDSQFCSVTAIFFLSVVGIFIGCALFHPREILNILHGVIYFLTIPSSSMLLIIYALGNLNNKTWGTREDQHKQTVDPAKGTDKDPKTENKLNVHSMSPESLFQTIRTKFSSDYNFSFGNLFRCICCPSSAVKEEDVKMKAILEKLESLEDQFDNLKDVLKGEKVDEDVWRGLPYLAPDQGNKPFSSSNVSLEDNRLSENPLYKTQNDTKVDDTKWIRDETLKGSIQNLNKEEKEFWIHFIDKYMKPINMSEKEEEQVVFELNQLRNKVCLFFFLLNALFITIIFILESVSRYSPGLTVQLPCDAGRNGQKIEPISIAFTVIFGILLIVQFICMLFHRVSTLIHIASTTKIKLKQSREEKERAKAQVIDTYHRTFKRYSGSISSIDSMPEDESGTIVDSITKRDRFFLKGLLKKSKQKQNITHSLFDVYAKKQELFVKKLEGIDVDQSEKELKNSVRRKFSNMPARSIKTIVEMAKDEEFKQKMREKSAELARKRWKNLPNKIIPKPAMSNIVNEAMKQRKKDDEGAGPENRQTVENDANDVSKISTEVDVRKRSVQFKNPNTRTETQENGLKKASNLWAKVTDSVIKEESDTELTEIEKTESSTFDLPKSDEIFENSSSKSWTRVADSLDKEDGSSRTEMKPLRSDSLTSGEFVTTTEF